MALRVTSDKQGTGVKHISDFVFHQGHGWARLPCSDTWDLRVETVLVIGGVAPLRHSFSIDSLEINVRHHKEKANIGFHYHNKKFNRIAYITMWHSLLYTTICSLLCVVYHLAMYSRAYLRCFLIGHIQNLQSMDLLRLDRHLGIGDRLLLWNLALSVDSVIFSGLVNDLSEVNFIYYSLI